MKNGCMPAWKTKLAPGLFALCIAVHCQNGWASDCATGLAPQAWSRLAQQKVENYSEKALAAENIIATLQSSKKDFLKSKPAIQDGKIYIQIYVPASAERGSAYDEIWCKLKTRDAITDAAVGGRRRVSRAAAWS